MVSWAQQVGTLKSTWARVALPVRFLLWTLVALVALVVLYRTINWRTAWMTLQTADLFWVGVAAFTIVATNVAKAARWRRLLVDVSPPPTLWHLLRVILIGQGLNTFLPIRIGDLARLRYLHNADPAAALGTIVLEKALDLLCFVGLAGLLLAAIPLPSDVTGQILAFIGTTLLLLSAGAILFIVSNHQRLARAHTRFPLLRPFFHLYQRFLAGWNTLRQRQDSIVLGGWSLLIWGLAVSTNLCIAAALHLTLPPISAVVLLVLLQIGITVIALPATIGVFEYICVVILGWFAVPEATALGFGIVLHLLVLVPNLIGVLLTGGSPRKRLL